MDFMSDQLVGGQRFRLRALVDNHSRKSLAIEVGQRLTGDDVVQASPSAWQKLGWYQVGGQRHSINRNILLRCPAVINFGKL